MGRISFWAQESCFPWLCGSLHLCICIGKPVCLEFILPGSINYLAEQTLASSWPWPQTDELPCGEWILAEEERTEETALNCSMCVGVNNWNVQEILQDGAGARLWPWSLLGFRFVQKQRSSGERCRRTSCHSLSMLTTKHLFPGSVLASLI